MGRATGKSLPANTNMILYPMQTFYMTTLLFLNLLRKRLQPHLRINKVEHGLMPQQTILVLQHPMILIRKSEKLALHTPTLQRVKRRQALPNQQPIIQLAVDDKVRCVPVLRVPAGIPLLPGIAVLPGSAL